MSDVETRLAALEEYVRQEAGRRAAEHDRIVGLALAVVALAVHGRIDSAVMASDLEAMARNSERPNRPATAAALRQVAAMLRAVDPSRLPSVPPV